MLAGCGATAAGRHAGKRCGLPAVANRDLGPAYGKLRLQPVCKQHARAADTANRLKYGAAEQDAAPVPDGSRPRTGLTPETSRSHRHDVARSGDIGRVAMVAPGGWRVVPITVVRGGRELRRYRVTRHGVFVCECRSPEEVAAAGVPLDQLAEEEDPGRSARGRSD